MSRFLAMAILLVVVSVGAAGCQTLRGAGEGAAQGAQKDVSSVHVRAREIRSQCHGFVVQGHSLIDPARLFAGVAAVDQLDCPLAFGQRRGRLFGRLRSTALQKIE